MGVVIGNSAAVGRRVYAGEPALVGSMPFCGGENRPETKKIPLRRDAEGFCYIYCVIRLSCSTEIAASPNSMMMRRTHGVYMNQRLRVLSHSLSRSDAVFRR